MIKIENDSQNEDGPSVVCENPSPVKKVKVEKEVKPKPLKKKAIEKIPIFKKGVINPNIELVGVDMQKEQTDSDLFTHCCIRCNNKNIIRAAITGNKRLLTLGIASKDKISSLTAYWGTEIKYTAIEYALFNNNIKLLELLLHPQNK